MLKKNGYKEILFMAVQVLVGTVVLSVIALFLLSATYSDITYGQERSDSKGSLNAEIQVDQDFAEKMALFFVHKESPAATVLLSDISYDYETGSPATYIIALALNGDFAGLNKDELMKAYEYSLSDVNLSLRLSQGIKTLYVSASKSEPPIPMANEGLPLHIMKGHEILKVASHYLRVPQTSLREGDLKTIYRKGIFRDILSSHGSEGVLVRTTDLKVMPYPENDINGTGKRKESGMDKGGRLLDYKDKWKFYEDNIESSSIQNSDYIKKSDSIVSMSTATTPVYIYNYTHDSLKWSQQQITSQLLCTSTGGCCFVASTTALLAFWDDNRYLGKGPFENVVMGGNGVDQNPVRNLATEVYNEIWGGVCLGDPLGVIDLCSHEIAGSIKAVTNRRGYSFTTSVKSLPSINDVISEVTNNRPFIWTIWFYDMPNVGEINHSVVGVGYYYDISNSFRIKAYTNWTSLQMYDFYFDNPGDYDTHAMVSVTPGGPLLPGNVNVNPTSGSWISSPKNISVSSNSSDKVYYTIRTSLDGSTPVDPPEPSSLLNDGSISGSSGTFQIYASAGQYKKLKVRFRGYNISGYGAASVPYLYTIDLRSALLANLTPYKPSTWSDKIVVSKTMGTNTDSAPLYASDSLYVDWAVVNNGNALIPTAFYTRLYIDGVLKNTWVTSSLLSNYYTYVTDFSIGNLSAGTHTIKIQTDATGVIGESNESDNEYTRTITVQQVTTTGGLFGKLHDGSATGPALSGATLTCGGKSITTGSDGSFSLSGITPGSQTLSFSKSGYQSYSTAITITAGQSYNAGDRWLVKNISPTIAMSPMSGPGGTVFTQWGTGFTPKSTATLYFPKYDGVNNSSMKISIDAIGHFEIPYKSGSNKRRGSYSWYAIDGPTGKKSNTVTYVIK